jgi:GMP reductase
MAKVLQDFRMMTVIRKHYTFEQWKQAVASGLRLKYVSACLGTGAIWDENTQDYQTLKQVMQSFPDIPAITIDVANAYHEQFVDFVKRIRSEYPDKVIIAGNVVSPEMTEELIINGADVVKIGIGPGSVCTTRTETGVGVPQFSAIVECADAANGVGGHIIADGGCTSSGDVAKALAAGAHFVMLGSMLASHNESELELRDGKRVFYGMSSQSAFDTHGARKDGYQGTEGKTVLLDDRGPVKDTVEQILGGVRSTCTYIGAKRIKDMPKCAHFVRVNQIRNQSLDRYDI